METPALGSSASLLCLVVGGAWLMSYESYVILCDLFTGFSHPRSSDKTAGVILKNPYLLFCFEADPSGTI